MSDFEKAIEILGGPARTARALSRSIQAVLFWRDKKRQFPADLCPTVERLTDGLVRCEGLRPDVEWAVLRAHVGSARAAE